MWEPNLPKVRPYYRSIVAALQQDISNGVLSAGTRLPTHRELAYRLKVTVGTVTKAFTEAERTGLIVSRVGRGTYVLQFPENVEASGQTSGELIDLSVNTVSIEPFNTALNKVLGALSRRKSLYGLLEYHPVPGLLRHRATGAKWLKLRGIDAKPDSIILCSGAQEALMAALATVTRPGDAVLTESLNYAGIRRLADLFRLDIRGVPTDRDGLRPDLLLDAAKGTRVGAILCSPTVHNPTTATMPIERRREILKVAAQLDTFVIEDDSGGHLSGHEEPTLATLAPDRCVYLCGTSKSIAPGLRIGFMTAPPSIMPRLREGVHATSWTSPTLMGEITSVLIEDGIADQFISWHRKEAVARAALASEVLGIPNTVPEFPSYHIWLQLPAPWRAGEFAAKVRLGNTIISPADLFAVDRSPTQHAVRISLGGVSERSTLAEGLRIIREALDARPGVG